MAAGSVNILSKTVEGAENNKNVAFLEIINNNYSKWVSLLSSFSWF